MHNVKGFTLVELMVTVVIVGILVAIAIPSYQNFIVKGNRSAVQAFMTDVQNRQKQYLLDARSYLAIANNSEFSNLGITAPTEVSNFYNLTVTVTAAPPAFTITATPIAGTSQADDGTLTLTSDGAKAPADKW